MSGRKLNGKKDNMSKSKKILILFVLIVLLCVFIFYVDKNDGWATYKDSVRSFSVKYPQIAQVITDKDKMAAVGYLPTCDTETGIVCMYLPSEVYPKTNFSGAALSINLLKDKKTEDGCVAPKPGETFLGKSFINQQLFNVSYVADAAMSHQSSGFDYRIFKNNFCYEITTRINTSSFEVWEKGSVNRFTDNEKEVIGDTLDKILATIKL